MHYSVVRVHAGGVEEISRWYARCFLRAYHRGHEAIEIRTLEGCEESSESSGVQERRM
jgi:hypothetical protein